MDVIRLDRKIKNYIFDLGKVLVHFDPMYMTKAYIRNEEDAALVSSVVFDRLYWDPLDDGSITDKALKEACHARLPERLHNVADIVYDNWYFHLPFIDGMEELVLDVKHSGAKVFLLSNVSSGFAEQYHRVPGFSALFSHFDGLVFSGPLGIVKPKAEIFWHLLKQYGLNPEETVFIDDCAKNIAGALAVGIHGYLFDGDAAKLRNTLNLQRAAI